MHLYWMILFGPRLLKMKQDTICIVNLPVVEYQKCCTVRWNFSTLLLLCTPTKNLSLLYGTQKPKERQNKAKQKSRIITNQQTSLFLQLFYCPLAIYTTLLPMGWVFLAHAYHLWNGEAPTAATEVMEVPTSPCAELLWNYDIRSPTFQPDRWRDKRDLWNHRCWPLIFFSPHSNWDISSYIDNNLPCSHGPKSSKIILMLKKVSLRAKDNREGPNLYPYLPVMFSAKLENGWRWVVYPRADPSFPLHDSGRQGIETEWCKTWRYI